MIIIPILTGRMCFLSLGVKGLMKTDAFGRLRWSRPALYTRLLGARPKLSPELLGVFLAHVVEVERYLGVQPDAQVIVQDTFLRVAIPMRNTSQKPNLHNWKLCRQQPENLRNCLGKCGVVIQFGLLLPVVKSHEKCVFLPFVNGSSFGLAIGWETCYVESSPKVSSLFSNKFMQFAGRNVKNKTVMYPVCTCQGIGKPGPCPVHNNLNIDTLSYIRTSRFYPRGRHRLTTSLSHLHVKDIVHDWRSRSTERIRVRQQSPADKRAHESLARSVLQEGPGNDAPSKLHGRLAGRQELLFYRPLGVVGLWAAAADTARVGSLALQRRPRRRVRVAGSALVDHLDLLLSLTEAVPLVVRVIWKKKTRDSIN